MHDPSTDQLGLAIRLQKVVQGGSRRDGRHGISCRLFPARRMPSLLRF
jgi:hypothetical protein